MKLIVGLGNPGREYEQTRHNVGFAAVDHLAEALFADPAREKFHGQLRESRLGSELVLLLKPQTYMNVSGKSVAAATAFYRLEPEQVLVICDDFAIPLPTVRIRASGSAGGQNGLKDVILQLGTDQVPRLRIGIGPVPPAWKTVDFVLGRFSEDERHQADDAIVTAAKAARDWVTEGLSAIMNRYNTKGSGSA